MTRKDIAILPADEPRDTKIGWTVKEYNGVPIFKSGAYDVYLNNKDDIKEGDKIIVNNHLMEVKTDDQGELQGHSERWLSLLEFSKDDRHCWISTCMINKRGLAT